MSKSSLGDDFISNIEESKGEGLKEPSEEWKFEKDEKRRPEMFAICRFDATGTVHPETLLENASKAFTILTRPSETFKNISREKIIRFGPCKSQRTTSHRNMSWSIDRIDN